MTFSSHAWLVPALALPLMLSTTACSSGGVTGIWMMQVSYPGADTCTDTISHNYTDAYVAGESTDTTDGWTNDESETHSDEIIFVQVETTGKDTALLVVGTQVWPGTKTAKGNYKFSWSGSDEQLQDDVHDSGYSYTYSNTALSEEQLVLVLDQGYGSGTWEATSTSEESWLESDTWSKQVGLTRGATPVGNYLVVEKKMGKKVEEVPAGNTGVVEDCDAANCSLTVTSACEGSLDVVLTQTDYSGEEAFNYMRNSGQNYGAN